MALAQFLNTLLQAITPFILWTEDRAGDGAFIQPFVNFPTSTIPNLSEQHVQFPPSGNDSRSACCSISILR
jgi:hypothetical protein